MSAKDIAAQNLDFLIMNLQRTQSQNGWIVFDENLFRKNIIFACGIFVLMQRMDEQKIYDILKSVTLQYERAEKIMDEVSRDSLEVADMVLKDAMKSLPRSKTYRRPYIRNRDKKKDFIDQVIVAVFENSNARQRTDGIDFLFAMLQRKGRSVQSLQQLSCEVTQELEKWYAMAPKNP